MQSVLDHVKSHVNIHVLNVQRFISDHHSVQKPQAMYAIVCIIIQKACVANAMIIYFDIFATQIACVGANWQNSCMQIEPFVNK